MIFLGLKEFLSQNERSTQLLDKNNAGERFSAFLARVSISLGSAVLSRGRNNNLIQKV